MPDFVGRRLGDVEELIFQAGFAAPEVKEAAVHAAPGLPAPPASKAPAVKPAPSEQSIISGQSPAPGQKILADDVIRLEVARQ